MAAVGTEFQVTFDCVDADRMSEFWATALGYVVQPPPPGFDSWEAFVRAHDLQVPPVGSISAIVDPDGVGPRILFQRVPEAKTVKNRVHLDLRAGGGDDAKRAMADRLIGAGATEVCEVREPGEFWIVMHDPEGNEFCVD